MRGSLLLPLLPSLAIACLRDLHTDASLGLVSRSLLPEDRAPFPPVLSTEESLLIGAFDNVGAETWLSYYTHGDHVAGVNKTMALWTADLWTENGIPSELVEYEVYLNYPVSASLSLTYGNGTTHEVSLNEDELPEDETTSYPNRIPAFHGCSASGYETAEYIYAGFGHANDFARLVALGIDLEGKIALIQYGGIFRGVKVKNAQVHGMIGVVIFTDPGTDGPQAAKGDVAYPHGPARQPSSIQRGSTCDITLMVGDPTTPGYPSKPGVARVEDSAAYSKIPSLPISFQEALPLLAALDGHGTLGVNVNRSSWVGGLNVTYSTGPAPGVTLALNNLVEYKYTPIWDVMGIINGTHADETIIVGNHRDAWVIGGAGDPNSGTAILGELTKAFGKLLKTGWKPRRNIVICSWDAEEYGIVGSTEWVEEYAPWLSGTAVSYINTDVSVSGKTPGGSASPELHTVARELMKKIVFPSKEESTLYDTWQSHYQLQNETNGFGTLGSGSDYTAFPQLGIGAMDFGMSGNATSPVYHYHSNYDSFHWMANFGDPGFTTHVSVGQYMALLVYHLATETLIPFDLDTYAKYVGYWTRDLLTLVNTFADSASLQSELDFPSLTAAGTVFTQRATDFIAYTKEDGFLTDADKVDLANHKLRDFQRAFAAKTGLPGREFYKNVAYAPAADNGYSSTTLPGVTDALNKGNRTQAAEQLKIVVDAILLSAQTLEIS